MDNPFLVGNPVPPLRYIGRSEILRALRSRLRKRESTAIVGGPHIGKSSTLAYLTSPTWLKDLQINDSPQLFIAEFDCYLMASAYRPADFWQHVFEQISAICSVKKLREQRDRVYLSNFGSLSLDRFFRKVAESNRLAVVLIDEFDALLDHPHFNSAEFFGSLRSLSSYTKGLALVTASRLNMTEMSRRTKQITGSDMFNTFRELQLTALTDAEIKQLLDSSLANTGVTFSDQDRQWIAHASGGHPYVVQAAGTLLYDNVTAELRPGLTYADMEELLADQLTAHFADVWRDLGEMFGDQVREALRQLARAESFPESEATNRALRRLYQLCILRDRAGSVHYLATNQHQIAGAVFRLWINEYAVHEASNAARQFDPEAEHIAKLRKIYQSRLRILEMQMAQIGSANAPPVLHLELAEVQQKLDQLDQR